MAVLKEPPLTYPEAAAYLNIPETALRAAVQRGELTPHYMVRRAYFTKEELTAWFNRRKGNHHRLTRKAV